MKVWLKVHWIDVLFLFTAFIIFFPLVIIGLILLWGSLFSLIGALL